MSPQAPDWLADLRPGCWVRISGDRPDLGLAATPAGSRYLADGDPARDPALNPAVSLRERLRRLAGRSPLAPWSGRLGFAAITEAWNGAVFASSFGSGGSMIVFGGGHTDYYGSDVHAFDLQTREWRRLTDGFVAGGTDAYGAGAVYPTATYPDGSPLPPHTYNYLQYDAGGNNLLLFKGQLELGPNVRPAAIPHLLNLDRLQWRRGPQLPGATIESAGFTAWDSRRRLFWGHSGDAGGGNVFAAFSPDGDNPDGTVGHWVFRATNRFRGAADHNAMTWDPERDRLLVCVASRNQVCEIDPGEPAAAPRELRVRAAGGCTLRECAALEYAPALGAPVYYSACDGATVYSLEPAAGGQRGRQEWRWVVRTSRANALDPVADARSQSGFETNASHTFGRMRVAAFAGIDVVVLVRHIDSPVYALRLN